MTAVINFTVPPVGAHILNVDTQETSWVAYDDKCLTLQSLNVGSTYNVVGISLIDGPNQQYAVQFTMPFKVGKFTGTNPVRDYNVHQFSGNGKGAVTWKTITGKLTETDCTLKPIITKAPRGDCVNTFSTFRTVLFPYGMIDVCNGFAPLGDALKCRDSPLQTVGDAVGMAMLFTGYRVTNTPLLPECAKRVLLGATLQITNLKYTSERGPNGADIDFRHLPSLTFYTNRDCDGSAFACIQLFNLLKSVDTASNGFSSGAIDAEVLSVIKMLQAYIADTFSGAFLLVTMSRSPSGGKDSAPFGHGTCMLLGKDAGDGNKRVPAMLVESTSMLGAFKSTDILRRYFSHVLWHTPPAGSGEPEYKGLPNIETAGFRAVGPDDIRWMYYKMERLIGGDCSYDIKEPEFNGTHIELGDQITSKDGPDTAITKYFPTPYPRTFENIKPAEAMRPHAAYTKIKAAWGERTLLGSNPTLGKIVAGAPATVWGSRVPVFNDTKPPNLAIMTGGAAFNDLCN